MLEPISVVKDQVSGSQISHDTDKYVPPGLLEIDNLLLILYSYTTIYLQTIHIQIYHPILRTLDVTGFRYQSIRRNTYARFAPLNLITILPARCLCSISTDDMMMT